MNIMIAGYTYIHDGYRSTFDHYPPTDSLFFLLPKKWKARWGAATFVAKPAKNIFTTDTFFYHSRYPIIRGLLKGWMPLFPFFLWKLRRQHGISLVYTCTEPTLLTGLYNGCWSKLFGVKHILFTWENIPYHFGGLKGFFRKAVLRLNLAVSDGIVCGNKKGEDICQAITRKPLAVIPPFGLDHRFFAPVKTDKKFMGHDLGNTIVFTFVGAVAFRKGVHHIINAFQGVAAKMPHTRLILAGNDEYGPELEDRIRTSPAQNNIIKLPFLSHEQLRMLLAVSDVFVYPSLSYQGWEEQFGYSMAEASLMELPVISTRTGSIEDVVVDGDTGFLVEPGNEQELSETMIKLAENADLRARMGQAGRAYIMNQFSQQAVANKFYDFFHRV